MPLKSAQLPRTLSSLWEIVQKIQRDLQELRSARTLENATIGGGQGLVVQRDGAGPSVKITPNASGTSFITQQQAAILISTGDPTEAAPGIASAYLDPLGDGTSVPGLLLLCPDTNCGTAATIMQGGSPDGQSPVWQAQAGASTLTFSYDSLVIQIAGGSSFTVDGSGLYFSGETWQTLTLNSSWTAFGSGYQAPIFMKKADGMVQMAGLIAPGTTTGGTTVATLPAGYIPSSDHVFRTSAGAAATADVYVRSTGAVQIQNPTGTVQWLALSGIRFPPVGDSVADATQYDHTLTVQDLNTLTEYPWKLSMPFGLNLTDDQVTSIMQVIAAALPPNQYGWKVSASVTSTTTTTTVTEHPYTPIDVPATPPATP